MFGNVEMLQGILLKVVTVVTYLSTIPFLFLLELPFKSPTTKYMTLGQNIYIFSVLSPRICFCFANPYFLAGIAAFVEILLLAASKHV